jgi:hypothetical protein
MCGMIARQLAQWLDAVDMAIGAIRRACQWSGSFRA